MTDDLPPPPTDTARLMRAPSDEVRVTSETGGQKGRKQAQLGAIDPAALIELAKVAGYGTEKYDRYNFLKGYAWSLSFDAAQRHLLAFWTGEDRDPESGLAHLGHAAWHCLAMLAFLQRNVGTDDRPDTPIVGVRQERRKIAPPCHCPGASYGLHWDACALAEAKPFA